MLACRASERPRGAPATDRRSNRGPGRALSPQSDCGNRASARPPSALAPEEGCERPRRPAGPAAGPPRPDQTSAGAAVAGRPSRSSVPKTPPYGKIGHTNPYHTERPNRDSSRPPAETARYCAHRLSRHGAADMHFLGTACVNCADLPALALRVGNRPSLQSRGSRPLPLLDRPASTASADLVAGKVPFLR